MRNVVPAKSLAIRIIAILISILLLSNVSGNDLDTRNDPPLTPCIPDGPPTGNGDIEYEYASNTTDPDGDQLYYLWDWGDNSTPVWYGPYSSGQTSNISHEWTELGTYQVRVKAKDNSNAESDWSEPLNVSIVGTTLYVGGSGPGNYSNIQDAIDDANTGDTVFVYNGTYNGHIVVGKSIHLIGEDKNTTIIDYGRNYVVKITADEVNISGFSITNSSGPSSGLSIHSNYNYIHNNIIDKNVMGVELYYSDNSIITGNIISDNGLYSGLCLYHSHNNTVTNNEFYNDGIDIIPGVYDNIIHNNSVNGKPLVYLKNESNYTITNAGQIILVKCDNISIINQNISNTFVGIQLLECKYCSIINNILSDDEIGIYCYNGNNNTFEGNRIDSYFMYGIFFEDAEQNIISRNSIIGLNGSYYSEIGIDLDDSNRNILFSNNVYNNYIGINLNWGSNDNILYHNNLVNNSANNHSTNGQDVGSNNIWNMDYPYGGNYWGDYNGTDGDGDGIGDIPYTFCCDNQDNYPLMNPIMDPPVFVWVDDDFNSSTPGWNMTHFDNIQNAIDSVDNYGTVYVFNGTYYENVLVDKTINMTAENSYNTTIKFNTSDFEYGIGFNSPYIVFSNFTIAPDMEKAGPFEIISINNNGGNVILSNCNIVSYDGGMVYIESDFNEIDNCSFFNVSELHIRDGSYNIIQNSSFIDNSLGLILSRSSGNSIQNNSFTNCGIIISGEELSQYYQTILNNTVNNKPIVYHENEEFFTLNEVSIGQLIMINCSSFDISNLSISNTACGIELAYCHDITINTCDLISNIIGVLNIHSSNNTIFHNIISMSMDGIYFYDECGYNIIFDNNISSNTYGIEFDESYNNTIFHNNFFNNYGGISLSDSYGNTIAKNSFNQSSTGITFSHQSDNNKIYHNNFLINNQNAKDYCNNIWDDDYPSGGNYWDDYTGIDSEPDGIGDTPYDIPAGNNTDNYPLMHPYGLITELKHNWNFVSLPTNLSVNTSEIIVFYNDAFITWQEAIDNGIISQYIFGWNRTLQSYQFDDTLIPGYGYWIYAPEDCELWTFNYERNLDGYITHLKADWNVLGSSCDYPLDKDILIINHNGSNYNWTEIVNMGIVSDFVFGWDNVGQSYLFSDTFDEGSCYWMFVYQECILKRETFDV